MASINIRIDSAIKERFDTFCEDAGMTPTTAISLFIRTVLREQRIPFEIVGSDDPFYSLENQARLRDSINQLNAGRGTARELIEVDSDD